MSGRGGFSAGVQEVKRRMAVRRIVLGFVYFILVPSFLIDFGWGRGRENVGTGIGEGGHLPTISRKTAKPYNQLLPKRKYKLLFRYAHRSKHKQVIPTVYRGISISFLYCLFANVSSMASQFTPAAENTHIVNRYPRQRF